MPRQLIDLDRIALTMQAAVPGIDEAQFQQIAAAADNRVTGSFSEWHLISPF